jgi:hypothetical protein
VDRRRCRDAEEQPAQRVEGQVRADVHPGHHHERYQRPPPHAEAAWHVGGEHRHHGRGERHVTRREAEGAGVEAPTVDDPRQQVRRPAARVRRRGDHDREPGQRPRRDDCQRGPPAPRQHQDHGDHQHDQRPAELHDRSERQRDPSGQAVADVEDRLLDEPCVTLHDEQARHLEEDEGGTESDPGRRWADPVRGVADRHGGLLVGADRTTLVPAPVPRHRVSAPFRRALRADVDRVIA